MHWTPEMESAFVLLKEALSAECELYIPSPDGEYCIHERHTSKTTFKTWLNYLRS